MKPDATPAADRGSKCNDLTPLYAMPEDLANYLLGHLRSQRAALDGFLALGNEVSRAQRLDGWIAALEWPTAKLSGGPAGRTE